jgi:hypothetical protein
VARLEFLARREPSLLARLDHAARVGVATVGGIAFGHQQHVLAESGQVAAAKGTPIGRRLAVLRAPRGPPPWLLGGHLLQHRSPALPRTVSSRAVEQQDQRIVVETARHRVTGVLKLPAEGYRSRLTDFLNARERDFIALTDASIEVLDGGGPVEQRPFVAVALRHVVLAAPAD